MILGFSVTNLLIKTDSPNMWQHAVWFWTSSEYSVLTFYRVLRFVLKKIFATQVTSLQLEDAVVQK